MSARAWITTVDSHTAGHPTRVVTGGLPPLRGETVAERCDYFRERHDRLRTFLLHEPRGHAAMVAAVLTESGRADFGAFFISTYKYLEMCGHATIGVAVTLDHLGLISPGQSGATTFTLEVPAGVITVHVTYAGERIAAVTFENVPAFVAARGLDVPFGGGYVTADVAYGGNWYGLVEAAACGVALEPGGVSNAMAVGAALKASLNAMIATGHVAGVSAPVDSILFHETGEDALGLVSRQLVVLEANKFDRSPCGTGTSARLAQLTALGRIRHGQEIRARNILGIDFTASTTPVPGRDDAVRPVVSGLAHITGLHGFVYQQGDPVPDGFLCR